MEELSLYSTSSIVNEAINVTYTPDSSVYYYTYQVLKDDQIIFESDILKENTNIILDKTGTYKIVFNEYNRRRVVTVKNSGLYELDLSSPVINSKEIITLEQADSYDLKNLNITAYDNHDGVISYNLDCNIDDIDFNEIGEHELICSVQDEAGNITEKEILVNIERAHLNVLLTLQITGLLFLVAIFIYMFKYERSLKLEKRIDEYSLKPIKDKSLSLFDKLYNLYIYINNSIANLLKHFKLFKKHSLKYEKYTDLYEDLNTYNLVVNKILSSLSLVLIISVIKSLQCQLLTIYEFIAILLIGYFIPNIIYSISKDKKEQTKEHEFLEAIIIMNNSFKSGKSIIQAVKTVVDELESEVSDMFDIVYQQLNLGNEVDEAFKDLALKLNLTEAYYLSSSLSVLNKTGGNVSNIFENIEKDLKDKKIIKMELRTITASAKLMSDILIVLPLLFSIIITIINPNYFKPLFTNLIGIVLFIIIISLYILYIIIVKKIIRVKE